MAKTFKKNNGGFEFSLLRHRTTLYSIFFLSLVYLFYLLLMMDLSAIFFFGLVGLVTSFFSKNMIIVLFISLVVTMIVNYVINLGDDSSDTVNKFVMVSAKNEEPLETENKETDKGQQLDMQPDERIPSGTPEPSLPMNVVLGEIPNGDASNAPLEASNANFEEVGMSELGEKNLNYGSV